MECLTCNVSFEPNRKGSGGTNRNFCFDCLPEGLCRPERAKRRKDLLVYRARLDKVNLGCTKCGYNKNPSALEWHHSDPEKDKNPADALARSWKLYQTEIESCTLLCANCHRESHYQWNL